MAKGMYVGASNVARKVKKAYVGVGGVARKVKKIYIGVGGVARLAWSGDGGDAINVLVSYTNTEIASGGNAVGLTDNLAVECAPFNPGTFRVVQRVGNGLVFGSAFTVSAMNGSPSRRPALIKYSADKFIAVHASTTNLIILIGQVNPDLSITALSTTTGGTVAWSGNTYYYLGQPLLNGTTLVVLLSQQTETDSGQYIRVAPYTINTSTYALTVGTTANTDAVFCNYDVHLFSYGGYYYGAYLTGDDRNSTVQLKYTASTSYTSFGLGSAYGSYTGIANALPTRTCPSDMYGNKIATLYGSSNGLILSVAVVSDTTVTIKSELVVISALPPTGDSFDVVWLSETKLIIAYVSGSDYDLCARVANIASDGTASLQTSYVIATFGTGNKYVGLAKLTETSALLSFRNNDGGPTEVLIEI